MTKVLPIAGDRAAPSKPVLRIGDLARQTNKSARAVRLYEEMGLLGAVFRTEGGHRVYGEDTLVRMAWIDKLQGLGFSLPQIREILRDWMDSGSAPNAMARVSELFRRKLEDTRAQVRMLESLAGELEDSLRYLETCEECDPCTVLGACGGCVHPHSVEEAPTLVAGFSATAEQSSDDV